MIDTFLQDVRFALRTLAKTPTFAAAVIATIALGVGATTAIFTVVDAVLLRPLPFPDSERVVVLCETNPSIGNWCGASPMNVSDWARTSRSLESAGVARTEPFIGRDGSESYGVTGGIASPGFFKVLRSRPILGRLLEERDMDRSANHVALVSYGFWQTRLAADQAIVGRTIVLDEKPFTIVGVLPADAYLPGGFLSAVEVWKPLTASVDRVEDRSWRGFTAIGRLAGGASPATLHAELETIRAQLARAYPRENEHWGLRIGGLREEMVGDVSTTLWIFLGAVAFVLLIACANVANLLLVRATGRAAEFAVRASLGAGRRRLVQQLVTESLVIALAGGALGLLLATWVTAAFVALAPSTIPRLHEVTIDTHVVIFAFVLAAATAVIFGAAPARRASKADLNDALKGLRATRGVETRLRSTLVVVEVALALMLLVGAGLLTRSFARMTQWDPGFDRTGLVTTWMLPPASVASPVGVMERVRDEVAAIPGVRAAALGSAGPLFGGTETGGLSIEGRAPFAPADMPTIEWFDIGPHYFATLGVRLVRGRAFTPADDRSAPAVAIVNETFARRFFHRQNPIGQRVRVNDHPGEIVGVVADITPFRPDRPAAPQIYWPIEQYRRGAAYLLIRTTPGIAGVERAVRSRAASVVAGIQLTPLVSLDERVARNLVGPRFNMLLVGAFAVVAMLLAAVGVYGVMAHAVASRTREIGLRIALGATPGQMTGAVVRQGMTLAALGIAAGYAGALATGRLLTSVLYGLQASDPWSLAGAVTLFALVALAACWLPARRASRMNPMVALRIE
jgi:putative ABC transport system permease protein